MQNNGPIDALLARLAEPAPTAEFRPHTIADLGQPDGPSLLAMANDAGIQDFELAQELGITPKHMRKFFEGKRWLDQHSVAVLLKMLGKDGKLHRISKADKEDEDGAA